MGHVHVWFLCGVLSVLTERGKQDAQPLTAPEQLTVYRDVDVDDLGVNILNVEWKHGFTNSIRPDKVTYDIRIFYTQQMKLVHKETIELNANQMGDYKWSWKSQIPLQCTSHSVQLRYRDHDQTSAWTPLKTLNGSDTPDIQEAKLYPQNREALVSEGIRFCCILKPEHNGELNSSVTFPIRISNQTYVTEPIQHSTPSKDHGWDVVCNNIGSTYYTGYPPDVHNITCETRDLHTVECRWNEDYIFRKTNYTVNGRNCTSAKFCVLTMTVGVTNWTLTAKNLLGQKTIFDTADPKHRVHLKAPELEPPASLTARNATLSWKWYTLLKDTSFSMICQVEVNGHIINGAFKVRNLSSVVLADLQPFTQYVARVRCGSHEHFYKWGDWSNNITFITKEDIPEAVDVWMQVFNEQTYVVWNSLSAAQSHGIIGYELVIGNSTERNKERINKSQEELCHNLQSGIAKTQVINISARNSAWVSPPSSITIPIMSGRDVDTSDIKGNNGSFDMVWKPSPKSTCGYVLDWYPTYQASQCAIKWIKVSSVVSSKTIYSDFIDGVKYTLSVYACTSGAPYLLQRREGYMVELPPLGTVQNLKAKQEGLNIYLCWSNVPEQEQRGFIKGYKIFYQSAGGDKGNVTLDPNTIEHKFNLSEDQYTFKVKAFTSAGDGPETDLTLQINPEGTKVGLVIVVCLAVMMSVFCIFTLLAYRNWKWLKSALWPEVPKPRLSEEFLKKDVYQWQVLDQLLYEESKVLKVKSSERCPVLIVPELQKERYETLALTSPPFKGSSWSEDYQILKSNPQTCPLIDVDFAYQELPGIQNPTYNLPLTNAVSNKNQESDYRPQTENCSIQQRPSNAYQWYHTPSNMPKLHFKDKFII
ncbi:LIF receptor subunit alpha b isoform 1-T1 [Clarias gariepinus]